MTSCTEACAWGRIAMIVCCFNRASKINIELQTLGKRGWYTRFWRKHILSQKLQQLSSHASMSLQTRQAQLTQKIWLVLKLKMLYHSSQCKWFWTETVLLCKCLLWMYKSCQCDSDLKSCVALSLSVGTRHREEFLLCESFIQKLLLLYKSCWF